MDAERDKERRASLDEPVRERLGRELRAAYSVDDKPAFLGDPALPPAFDEPVRRLHQSRKAHETGVAAVERALSELTEPEGSDDEAGAPGRRDRP
jgi:hypothetical protein